MTSVLFILPWGCTTCALAITILMYLLILEDTSLVPRLSLQASLGTKLRRHYTWLKFYHPCNGMFLSKLHPSQLHYLVLVGTTMADKSLVYHIFAVLLQEIKFQSSNLRHMLITNQMVDGVESHKLEKSLQILQTHNTAFGQIAWFEKLPKKSSLASEFMYQMFRQK